MPFFTADRCKNVHNVKLYEWKTSLGRSHLVLMDWLPIQYIRVVMQSFTNEYVKTHTMSNYVIRKSAEVDHILHWSTGFRYNISELWCNPLLLCKDAHNVKLCYWKTRTNRISYTNPLSPAWRSIYWHRKSRQYFLRPRGWNEERTSIRKENGERQVQIKFFRVAQLLNATTKTKHHTFTRT